MSELSACNNEDACPTPTWCKSDGKCRALESSLASTAVLAIDGYIPEVWRVEKDAIYAAITAVEAGLEYARELLIAHDSALGRTTLKNKTWAETIENDICHMKRTLEMLRACGPNVCSKTP